MHSNKLIFILICLITSTTLFAQDVKRPPILGIAKMTFWVSNMQLAHDYYGDFLGFDKAFSYTSTLGTVTSFKVNDRQFLEFITAGQAKEKSQLVSVSFETENAEKMEEYLLSKNILVERNTYLDDAGNKVFLIHDPSGVPIEFIEYGEKSLHRQCKGKFLSLKRIATRIHHVGLYSKSMEDEPAFYTQTLGFKRVLRVPVDKQQNARIIYFRIPESAEMIEHYQTTDPNFNHPCFVSMDIQETYSILSERNKGRRINAPSIGLGKRWLLNLVNSDGIKVEFTELYISFF